MFAVHLLEKLKGHGEYIKRGKVKQLPEIKTPQVLTLVIIREAFYNAVFWVKMIDRLESELNFHGIKMKIFIADDFTDSRDIHDKNKTNGYIIMGVVSKDIVKGLEKTGLPIFLIDYKDTDSRHDHVRLNNKMGMKLMAQKILDYGHKNILFMGDVDFSHSYKERYAGLLEAINDQPNFKCKLGYLKIVNGIKSIDERDSLLEIVSGKDAPTVLVGANDMISLEAMEILKRAHIRVPEDISIVGHDNIAEANFSDPKLTTIAVPKIDLASILTEIILKKFSNPSQPNRIILVEPKLIERDSLIGVGGRSR